MTWKRLNFLLHRWVGIVLGAMMVTWFGSGIVMMYYPYPELTPSERRAALEPFPAGVLPALIGMDAARDRAHRVGAPVTAGRLQMLEGRLVYQFVANPRRFSGGAVVDAQTGAVLSPIGAGTAVAAAARLVPAGATVRGTELEARGDHYVMGTERAGAFPAWKVEFGDATRHAVYVARATGEPFARVDRRTRLTTWLGTVPHWLYFQWLYDDIDAWVTVNIVLPAAACLIALTGMILGIRQLYPRRKRGDWRASGYHGVSRWHHLAGVVFGALVLTWTLSGILSVLGPSATPTSQHILRASGGEPVWSTPVDEVGAVGAVRDLASPARVVSVARDRRDGRPGFLVTLEDGGRHWVDGATGAVPTSATDSMARAVALRTTPTASAATMTDLLTRADAYYYAPHDRERLLPVWRVRLDDAARTAVYLDPVTMQPTAVVDAAVRRWRWWREGLHDVDVPGLNARRPLWDVVVLPLMLGGFLGSFTGVWLMIRRLRRLGARAAA